MFGRMRRQLWVCCLLHVDLPRLVPPSLSNHDSSLQSVVSIASDTMTLKYVRCDWMNEVCDLMTGDPQNDGGVAARALSSLPAASTTTTSTI